MLSEARDDEVGERFRIFVSETGARLQVGDLQVQFAPLCGHRVQFGARVRKMFFSQRA